MTQPSISPYPSWYVTMFFINTDRVDSWFRHVVWCYWYRRHWHKRAVPWHKLLLIPVPSLSLKVRQVISCYHRRAPTKRTASRLVCESWRLLKFKRSNYFTLSNQAYIMHNITKRTSCFIPYRLLIKISTRNMRSEATPSFLRRT